MFNYSQIIYVDPSDNLDIVLEEFKKSQKKKVILVLPEENKNLKNIENLTILKKNTQSLNKDLTIFTSDNQYRKLAEDCGIEIEKSLMGGAFSKKGEISFRPKVRDILPRERVFSLKEQKRENRSKEKSKDVREAEKPEEKKLFNKEEIKEFPVAKKKRKRLSILAGLFIFVILAGGIFFSLVWLPRAEIIIIPASEEIEFSGKFTVKDGENSDYKAKIISGTLIEKEKETEKSFLSTGKEKKIEKAKGEITIYNEDGYSHRFVPSTRFESPDGKFFKSIEWINIPAGSKENPGTVEIEVIASEAGEEYNIEPADFTVPGLEGTNVYELVYAKSAEAMKGGLIGEAKVVAGDDIKKAEKEMKELEENLISDIKSEILKGTSSNLQFLSDSILIIKEGITFDKKAGDIGKDFLGKVKVKAKLLNFNEDDVQEIVADIIAGRVKENIEFEEIVSTQEIQYKTLKNDIENGVAEISFEGKEKVAWRIDLGEIKKEVYGMEGANFREYIREKMDGKIENGYLELWPFWVNKVSEREDRVFLRIQYKQLEKNEEDDLPIDENQ